MHAFVRAALVAFVVLVGCAHTSVRPAESSAANSELEGLKAVAKMPGALPLTQVALAQQFIATDNDRRGLDYFAQRVREDGEAPTPLALQALFMARVAGEVPLARRIRWVEDALARLDRAAAEDHPIGRLFRGVVGAAVPKRFGRAEAAVADLQWVLEHPDAYPVSVQRGALYSLAQAHATLGDAPRAADALRRSGHTSLEADAPVFFGDAAWTRKDGFRFNSPPRLDEVAPGVFVASGYDFAEQIFFVTDDGVVAIDACSSPENARAALAALRREVSAPLTHVILTHAHEDHAGGLSAYATDGVEVIAGAAYEEVVGGLARQPGARMFWPGGWDEPPPNPSRVVRERQRIEVGGRSFDLIPAAGGETVDALLIMDVRTSTLVVGDVLMPYFGAPFANEGSPSGAIAAIRTIRALAPKRLLHGHGPLTALFNLDALPGLEAALTELAGAIEAAVTDGRSDADVIARNIVPDALRDAPAAGLPYIIVRNQFIQRTFRQRVGYWSGDGAGVAPRTRAAWAGALDLVARGKPRALAKAARALLDRGELSLAFEIADLGAQRHPGHKALQRARADALRQLRLKNHAINPFKFILYSAMADEELPPL